MQSRSKHPEGPTQIGGDDEVADRWTPLVAEPFILSFARDIIAHILISIYSSPNTHTHPHSAYIRHSVWFSCNFQCMTKYFHAVSTTETKMTTEEPRMGNRQRRKKIKWKQMEKNWPASGAWCKTAQRTSLWRLECRPKNVYFVVLTVEQRTICFPQRDFCLILFTVSPSAMYSTSFWVHVVCVCMETVVSIIMCCSYRYWRLALPQIETLLTDCARFCSARATRHSHTK